jgi:ATP-dependent Lon protease
MNNNPREILPIVPLRNLVMFPGVAMTLDLGGPGLSQLVAEMAMGRAPRVLLLTRGGDDDELRGSIGVAAEVKHVTRRPRGGCIVVVQGLARVRVAAPLQLEPFLTAEVEPVEEIAGDGPEHDALVRTVRDRAVQLMREEEAPRDAVAALESIDSPSRLADTVGAHGGFRVAEAAAIQAELDVQARLAKTLAALERRLAERAEAARLMKETDPALREKVLREKMAEIQAELGEAPAAGDEWSRKIAEAKLPPEVAASFAAWATGSSRPTPRWRATTSSACSSSPGRSCRRARSSSTPRAPSSRPTTPAWRRSSAASSSTWRCAS